MSSDTAPSIDAYKKKYQDSIEDPEAFWGQQAEQLISWEKPWKTVLKGQFGDTKLSWFDGATLNACYNCLDRHLDKHKDKVALYWEGNEPNEFRAYTYQELYEAVCRFANVLKEHKITKGNTICIYMPMIPEAAIAMLACARIGAVHSVVFGGFSAEALCERIKDSNCTLVITADFSFRGNKKIPLKLNVDAAIEQSKDTVHSVIVVKRSDSRITMKNNRDYWYHEEVRDQKTDCPITYLSATDPLFILYTSGSTGKPKGILHTVGGYLVYVASTYKNVFDIKDDDIFFCSADVGWITGHSYFLYGPMLLASTQVMFEGIPTYPTAARFWEVIDKYNVTIFYTAPTALRALMREGNKYLSTTKRKSLRLLGSVGEPINPEAWEWYYNEVGNQHCPIIDTWWQTETGGIMITPLPGITPLKPGSASWPFYGITPAIVNDKGEEQSGECLGDLVITTPWPGMLTTIYKDDERMEAVYFGKYPGKYLTGDTARRDKDGYYWIIGRNDDVINVSGHRIGTAEVESAITETPGIAEAAVVDAPHDITGQAIYAFVTPNKGIETNEKLQQAIIASVVKLIGPFAKPHVIQWTPELPKTRSGKIMRRILRKIASGDTDELGDISTLSNPEIIAALIKGM